MEITQNLKALRQERGLTIKSLSELSGISEGILVRTEIGQRRITLDILEKLSQTYQVPLSALVPNLDDLDTEAVNLVVLDRPDEYRATAYLRINLKTGGIRYFNVKFGEPNEVVLHIDRDDGQQQHIPITLSQPIQDIRSSLEWGDSNAMFLCLRIQYKETK